jgi:hypothetical protein
MNRWSSGLLGVVFAFVIGSVAGVVGFSVRAVFPRQALIFVRILSGFASEARNAPKKPDPLYNAARSGFRDILVWAYGQEVAREPMVSSEFIQAASATAFDPGRGAGHNVDLIFTKSGFSYGVLAST